MGGAVHGADKTGGSAGSEKGGQGKEAAGGWLEVRQVGIVQEPAEAAPGRARGRWPLCIDRGRSLCLCPQHRLLLQVVQPLLCLLRCQLCLLQRAALVLRRRRP